MTDASQRTIPATPRRREAARAEGLMPTAAPLAWAAAALTTVVFLPAWMRATVTAATTLLRHTLPPAVAGRSSTTRLVDASAEGVVALLLPALGLAMAAATASLAVRVLCDGFVWQPARLVPRGSRVSPLAGLARIGSWKTPAALIGMVLGLIVLGLATATAGRPLGATLTAGAAVAPGTVVEAAWRALMGLAVAAALVAVAQYGLARRRFERRIRMTPQEFAEEARALQADPKIRLLQHTRQRRA